MDLTFTDSLLQGLALHKCPPRLRLPCSRRTRNGFLSALADMHAVESFAELMSLEHLEAQHIRSSSEGMQISVKVCPKHRLVCTCQVHKGRLISVHVHHLS